MGFRKNCPTLCITARCDKLLCQAETVQLTEILSLIEMSREALMRKGKQQGRIIGAWVEHNNIPRRIIKCRDEIGRRAEIIGNRIGHSHILYLLLRKLRIKRNNQALKISYIALSAPAGNIVEVVGVNTVKIRI